MKKLISLILSGALVVGIFSGLAATQPSATPEPSPALSAPIDAPATIAPIAAQPEVTPAVALSFAVNADKTPIYNEKTGKVAMYANKGFSIAAKSAEADKVYFEMGYNNLSAPLTTYYVNKSAVVQSEPNHTPMPLSISGDTIVLKKNAKLYDQEGKLVATNNATTDRFYYVLKNEKGYNFQFAGNYLYVATRDASLKSAIEGTKELAKVLNADKKVKTVNAAAVEKLPAGMTYYSILKKLGATKDIGSGMYVASYGVKGTDKTLSISFASPFEICPVDGKTILQGNGNMVQPTPTTSTMQGVVKELYEDNSFLFTVTSGLDQKEVVIRYENAIAPKIAMVAGTALEIEHNGIMTKSIPAQMNAIKITIADSKDAAGDTAIKNAFLSGTIVSLSETENSLTMDTKEMGEVVVHYGQAKAPRIAFAKGQKLTVEYNGATTMSLPPQISALVITID